MKETKTPSELTPEQRKVLQRIFCPCAEGFGARADRPPYLTDSEAAG